MTIHLRMQRYVIHLAPYERPAKEEREKTARALRTLLRDYRNHDHELAAAIEEVHGALWPERSDSHRLFPAEAAADRPGRIEVVASDLERAAWTGRLVIVPEAPPKFGRIRFEAEIPPSEPVRGGRAPASHEVIFKLVHADTQRPYAGTEIVVRHPDGSDHTHHTNRDGIVHLRDVEPGEYRLTAIHTKDLLSFKDRRELGS
jgi:hypothetical protein